MFSRHYCFIVAVPASQPRAGTAAGTAAPRRAGAGKVNGGVSVYVGSEVRLHAF